MRTADQFLKLGRFPSLPANTSPTRKRGILRGLPISLPRLRVGLVFLNVKN
jgi:hypothetical protein